MTATRQDAGADEPGSPYRCRLATEVETYRLKKYVGSYTAALGWVDAVVFTAGVGENDPEVRALTVRGLERRGFVLDEERNATLPRGVEGEISKKDSPIKIFVIPTDEERVFVEDAVAILDGTYDLPDRFEYSFQKSSYVKN